MHGLVAVDWILTGVFVALLVPCVRRLARLDYARLGAQVRHGDLVELLFVVAMVVMLSPAGGPIPAAGWQAVFALVTGWFAVAWWRARHRQVVSCHAGRPPCGHHALSALAMFAMVTVMPHGAGDRGPWLTMSTMDSPAWRWWPVAAAVVAAYFVFDAARAGVLAVRAGGDDGVVVGETSRAVCRAVMGAGMGYLFVAAL
ncbi:DUF5134 domain-containing protein [Amycolatopsis samaneae]|uniref:DUF5134 domain-containing protein n=1 Tax=Amycolatopsis samaneae TaxID=664691 RepID=A0ABW5GEM0_9PSEU